MIYHYISCKPHILLRQTKNVHDQGRRVRILGEAVGFRRGVALGLFRKKRMVSPERALPGRREPMPAGSEHLVLGTRLTPPFPDGLEQAVFGMGCFWGAERVFWSLPGVYTTAVGYAGGFTPNPTYREVCSGRTGHAEVVLVVFDPSVASYERLLGAFFEGHDPTQRMRQGSDVGTQYRSAIYTTSPEQAATAHRVAERFGERLAKPATAPSRRRSRRAGTSTTPSRTTSSISRPTPADTAAWVARASRVPLAWPGRRDHTGDPPPPCWSRCRCFKPSALCPCAGAQLPFPLGWRKADSRWRTASASVTKRCTSSAAGTSSEIAPTPCPAG